MDQDHRNARREELDALLVEVSGTENVYFQPPPNLTMQYPCVVYERDSADTEFADNRPYHRTQRYQVSVISRNPDSEIPSKIAELPMCIHSRFFTADNLNHDVFTLFF